MNVGLYHLDSILSATREIASTSVRGHAERTDSEAIWPRAGIEALQSAGLGGLVVPRRFGGNGQGLEALAMVCEILGRECASTAICFGMHCVGSSVISVKANDWQVENFLQPICEGTHLTTLALSEAGSGAHFYLPQTLARKADGGGYVLSGEKTFVTNGGEADSYVVSAAGDGQEGNGSTFSCYVLPSDREGLSWGEPWLGFGMRGNSSKTLAIADATLPPDALLGIEGDQIWYVFNVVAPYFLIAMAGTYLGIAAGAIDETIGHLRNRMHGHSGSRLSQVAPIQQKLGDLAGELELARSLTRRAAISFDSAQAGAAVLVMMAKAKVADAAVQIVNECMTLMGGIAYRENSRLQRNLRDARASHVMAPTTDLLKIWIGRSLLGEPLLGE